MRNNKGSGTGLKWVLIAYFVAFLSFYLWDKAHAAEAPQAKQDRSILINKDGSITVSKELLEEYKSNQTKRDAKLEEQEMLIFILKNKLEALTLGKCVGVWTEGNKN